MRFVKVCLSVGAVSMAGCANLGGPANGGGSGDDGDEAVLGSLEDGECRDASHCGDNEFCLFDEGVCDEADGVGVCAEIVDICTEEYAPVCGCDGQTYGNACFAHAAGTSVAQRGTCEGDQGESAFCGGLAGEACPDSQFCLFEEGTCGAADQGGTCTDIPEACTFEFAPVCGCDDQTYDNECVAYAAGVSIVQRGACDSAGDENTCGGITGLSCPDAEFCLFEEGTCGAADQTGACMPYPEACTEQFEPVCGCDDQTHANECFAYSAGVSIVHRGSCEGEASQGDACGGLLGLVCAETQYCQFEEGTCGAADQPGVCRELPEACTEQFEPVCGCDDQTYDNECFAAEAGVSIVHRGACESGDDRDFCGGIAGFACPDGQFCLYEEGTCGAADLAGACLAIPENCTEEFAPVCGCDDQTYDNECFAYAASVNIVQRGACP